LIFGPNDDIYVLAGQYSQFTLDYFVYDSTTTNTANLYVDENIASTGEVNTNLQYSTKLSTAGDSIAYVYSG